MFCKEKKQFYKPLHIFTKVLKKNAVIQNMNRRDENFKVHSLLHNWRRIRDFKEHVPGNGRRLGFRRTSRRTRRDKANVQ